MSHHCSHEISSFLLSIPKATQHFWCQAAYAGRCIPLPAQPICGCNNCKMRSTLRNSHKAMLFMSHSWGKHPWVMTTSVGPALTTKLLKLCWLTSQENPRERPKRACYLRGGGDRGGSDTGSGDINLHLHLTAKNFYIEKKIKKERKSVAFTLVEKSYASSSLQRGLDGPHSFLFMNTVGRMNKTTQANVQQFDSRKWSTNVWNTNIYIQSSRCLHLLLFCCCSVWSCITGVKSLTSTHSIIKSNLVFFFIRWTKVYNTNRKQNMSTSFNFTAFTERNKCRDQLETW